VDAIRAFDRFRRDRDGAPSDWLVHLEHAIALRDTAVLDPMCTAQFIPPPGA